MFPAFANVPARRNALWVGRSCLSILDITPDTAAIETTALTVAAIILKDTSADRFVFNNPSSTSAGLSR